MSMSDDDIGGFDEGPLEIVVGLLSHATVACLASAGVHFRNNTGIGSQVVGGGEAIDGADLSFDDDGEDVPHAGDGFQQLHVGCELDALF